MAQEKTIKLTEEQHADLETAKRILSAMLDRDLTFGETIQVLSESFVDDTEGIQSDWNV